MIVSLSGIIIPLILFMILLYGMISKKEMYQPFLEGVQDGFKVVMEIAPTLIALFLAVQIFRTSGALDVINYFKFYRDMFLYNVYLFLGRTYQKDQIHPGRCSSGNLRRSNGQCISHRDALKTGAGKISSPRF